MERRSDRNSSPRFMRAAAELGVRPLEAIAVQERPPRMVTNLVTSRTGSCYGSNTVSPSGKRPGGISPPQRIASPLPGRSPESGEVLTSGREPVWPPADSGELQPELQPGTGAAARAEPVRGRHGGRVAAPPCARMLARRAIGWERGNAAAQCTPARSRCTASAPPLAAHLLAPARTPGRSTGEIAQAGR